MSAFANWSIRYKLLSLLLLLFLTTFAVIGSIASVKYLAGLKQQATNQLMGVRRSKAFQIEYYYRTIGNHVRTLSDDWMVIDAAKEFRQAYGALNMDAVPAQVMEAVYDDYRYHFYPELQELKVARPDPEEYFPSTPAAFQLQYLYIVRNPYPASRRMLDSAADGSEYSRVHAKYHPAFRKIIEAFGYYNLYLIDYQTERILYSVNKNRDFGTSLKNGPYSKSNLAGVIKQCLTTGNPEDVFLSDFEPYEAYRGEPTQFVASPIWDGKERVGILAMQLSTDAIENVVTGDRHWEADGLGRTGQTLIVGSDYRARTNPRQFLTDSAAFLNQLKAAGADDAELKRIREYKSTILQLDVPLPSVTEGLGGKEGQMVERALKLKTLALVSYMPLHIPGLHWMIESRMRLDEALKPVSEMRRLLVWWGAGLLLLAVLAAWLLMRQILRPINALMGAVKRVKDGDLSAKVEWKWKDELGVLSDTFNSMTKSIREKTELIEEKNRENEALLLNILPGEIAARLKGGEQEIADSFAEVTVLFGDLVGFTSLSSKIAPDRLVEMLNGLFSRFDQSANELGIEKIKTIGDCYMAVSGLPKPCPNHAEKMAQMALRMVAATREYGLELGLDLRIRIGLNSGPVVAGVIGTSKFIYDLWGDTVNLASRMESTGIPGEIQVTRSVYEELKDEFEFESRGIVQVKGKGEIETWLLHGRLQLAESLYESDDFGRVAT